MASRPKTLLERFWARTFDYPDKPAFYIRNRETAPKVIYPSVGAIPSASPAMSHRAVIIKPPAFKVMTQAQARHAIATVMAFLKQFGFKKGDRAAILAWNCPEWVCVYKAIQSLGGIAVPIYPHSTVEQINFILQNSGATFLFSNNNEQLKEYAARSQREARSNQTITTIHFDRIAEIVGNIVDRHKHTFLDWFIPNADGKLVNSPANWEAVQAQERYIECQRIMSYSDGFCGITYDDIATLIYTSGSTGRPKGCMLTHGNIAYACKSMVEHGFEQTDEDRYLSYLPLAHVFELVDGLSVCLWCGVPAAFCTIDDFPETVKAFGPTVLVGVPAVWRKIKERAEGKMAVEAGIKRWFIDQAFKNKALPAAPRNPNKREAALIGFLAFVFNCLPNKLTNFILDQLVFKKIRGELGGRLRVCITGGAPISLEVLKFYDQSTIQIVPGYGLSETTGGVTAVRPAGSKRCPGNCNRPGSTGELVPYMEMRIIDDNNQIVPAGEIGEVQFKGPLVFKGYWDLPDETAKTFTTDGWFKTGDLGRMDGIYLHITGRKKRMLKTDGGKYVPPEKIETSFDPNGLVQYVVPVGDGQPYISALIFLNQNKAAELLGKDNVMPTEANERAAFLATYPSIVKAVEQEVLAVNAKLERWETLKKFRIIPIEASVAAGLLTITFKIRTEEVLTRYAGVITEMYSEPKVKSAA